MAAILKTGIVQENSSSVANLTLDSSGNVTVGNNLTVTGSIVPSGSSVPTNGMYLPSANTLGFSTNSTQRAVIDSSGNLQVGGTTVGNTTGYVNSRTNARAWVNFNGTLSTPITPRANYNVSSVTKNATGNYTLNFTTALADANYSISGTCSLVSTGAGGATVVEIYDASVAGGSNPTTTALQIYVHRSGVSAVDQPYVCVNIFGN